VSQRAREALRKAHPGLGATQAPPPSAVTSSAPAPTMSLSDIASALAAFQVEVGSANIAGASVADGIAWGKIKGDLTREFSGLFALGIQAQDWFYQVEAMQTWQGQAQAYIATLEANLAACVEGASTPSQPDAVVAAIAVGSLLFGGIVGFVGGRNAVLGGKFRWTW
jgi:hypothetical protein